MSRTRPPSPESPATEQVDARFRGIDTWDSRRILDAMIADQATAVRAVADATALIERAAEAAVPRLRRGGRLVFAGAGTSGRIALQDGVELTPTFGWPRERMAFLLAGGEAALVRAIEGAEDDAGAGRQAVDDASIGADDVMVALAASGTTPFTVAALERAQERGAIGIGVANSPRTPLLDAAAFPILLDTGPEVVAGSTRMKAGTAQKVMMNLLSTLLMIRLGRVYEGYMVDVQATNQKLVRRSERMLSALTGRDEADARQALRACGGRVKPAILVLHGLAPAEADAALARAEGNVRSALGAIGVVRDGDARRASGAGLPSSPED